MYKSYKLLTMTVNVKGGESETIDHLYKEVDGKPVPMTEEEAILKMLGDTARIGGNASTSSIKTILFDTNGNGIKTEEVIKPIVVEPTNEEIKKANAEKALADYLANPTDETLAKIKEVVTEAE